MADVSGTSSPARGAEVDHTAEIALLCAFEGRVAGSDAERRAARHLEAHLRTLGRESRVEATSVRPAYPIAHAVNALVAIAGSVVAVSKPLAGAALVLLALFSTFADLTGGMHLSRRLTGRRASQNVVSRETSGKPGTLVLVAHYDAARGGGVFGRRVAQARAAAGRPLRRAIGLAEPFFWAMAALLLSTVLLASGLESTPVTTLQFAATIVLIASLPLLADIALSPVSPGANDNASGVATVLALAQRFGGRLRRFDIWVVLPGAEEGFGLGMRAWLRRHRRELDRRSTVFINVDAVGNGDVRFTRREGFVLASRSHPQLVDLCEQIAEDDEDARGFAAQPIDSRTTSDGHLARARGYPSISISCRDGLGRVPGWHQPTDTPEQVDPEALERALGFCSELIERLDREIGPKL